LTEKAYQNIPLLGETMANLCELTGKRPMSGHNVSHSNNKTKRKFFPNIKKVTLRSEILNKNIRFKISTRALKAVDFRGGIDEFLIRAKNAKLALRVKKIKKQILAKSK
jgi:large subunit ribosomal protein L28